DLTGEESRLHRMAFGFTEIESVDDLEDQSIVGGRFDADDGELSGARGRCGELVQQLDYLAPGADADIQQRRLIEIAEEVGKPGVREPRGRGYQRHPAGHQVEHVDLRILVRSEI